IVKAPVSLPELELRLDGLPLSLFFGGNARVDRYRHRLNSVARVILWCFHPPHGSLRRTRKASHQSIPESTVCSSPRPPDPFLQGVAPEPQPTGPGNRPG